MRTDTFAHLDGLVSKIYDAVMEPQGFQGFIERLIDTFQLKAAMLVTRHAQTNEVNGLWVHGLPQEWLELYAMEYGGEDVLSHHILASPIAHFYASNLDLPDPEQFVNTRFYREWVAPQGVAFATGAIVLREGDWLSQLILQRTPEQPPFSRIEMDHLNKLIPHLQRAIQMRQRFADLQHGQNFLACGLGMLAMPTILMDEFGCVAYCNPTATRILEGRRDLWVENGRLSSRDMAITRKLNLEISNAIRASRGDATDAPGIVLLPRPGRTALMLMISPLSLHGNHRINGSALLFAFDPETTPNATSEVVQRLFCLSPAEAELAVALCGGRTLEDAAIERGTSLHTVRSQLKSIFNKTGTSRQANLISVLLASPAYFLSQDAGKPVSVLPVARLPQDSTPLLRQS